MNSPTQNQDVQTLFKVLQANAKIYLVGGAVRDQLLGRSPKDWDWCVVGIDCMELEAMLNQVGIKFDKVGVSFFSYKLDGNMELVLPRLETSTGSKHSDFVIESHKNLTIWDDLERRDFTINAMAKEWGSNEIIDPYGGKQDLADRILRTPSNPHKTFSEDPLRMLRAFQFAARFGFKIEPYTYSAIEHNLPLLSQISGERLYGECEKVWSQADVGCWNLFTSYMKDTGLFGQYFNPITLKMGIEIKDTEKRILFNLISFFFNGGDFGKLVLSNTQQRVILLARLIDSGIDYVNFKFAASIREYLPLISYWFDVNNFESLKLITDKLTSTPLLGKDLVLTGEDLLNLGYEGKQIGEVQHAMINACWNGLENNKDNLVKYLMDKEITPQ